MRKTMIAGAVLFFYFVTFNNLQASDSDDLNPNPQIGFYSQVEAEWVEWLNHSDAKDLIFHVYVLNLLRSGSNDEAIKILEKELIKKGDKTVADNRKLKTGNNDDNNLMRKDIDFTIKAYNKYIDTYLKGQH